MLTQQTVYTRIQTRESVSKTQSAFMIDLNQVSLALRNCTSRSLIILDEFGKGTLPSGEQRNTRFASPSPDPPTDGAGLFCGVLKHLQERAVGCPKVLVATHFHDVFTAAILGPDAPLIGYVHMEVMVTSARGDLIEHQPLDERSSVTSADGASEAGRLSGRITYLYR
jgi:DNA mismatch repair protein MSH5